MGSDLRSERGSFCARERERDNPCEVCRENGGDLVGRGMARVWFEGRNGVER